MDEKEKIGTRQSLRTSLPVLISTLHDQHHLILDTMILGVVGALSAQIFLFLLHLASAIFLNGLAGYYPPGLPNEGGSAQAITGRFGLWLIPVVTTLGGVLTGFLVYTFAPEAEGHGTDAAVGSFHRQAGRIRPVIPIVKTIASAITLGSGGAGGREGPTALISAGVGSIYANFTNRPEDERRLLVLVGMASGLAAIFRSPIGTAIFAIEVLYANMEFEASALLYTMLGSIIAYAINGLFVGYEPLFKIPAGLPLPNAPGFLWYAFLGVFSGILASVIPSIFYHTRDLFALIPIQAYFKPALGGLAVGLLELLFPQVIGGGYAYMQRAIDGTLPLMWMGALTFVMIIGLSLTISSGGSAGVFAPCLFVGTMLGGFLAKVFHQPAAAFAVVGMAAVFGGAARVPVATLLMVSEMTGGYTLLVPASLAVMLSYLIQASLTARLKYPSLYEQQVETRAESPAHHAEQIDLVLNLLNSDSLALNGSFSEIDLRKLIAVGIPVVLPDHKHLMLGVIPPESVLVGKLVQEAFPPENQDTYKVISVFRQGHTLLPKKNLTLKAGDRMMMVTTLPAWESLAGKLQPLSSISRVTARDNRNE